MTPDCEIINNVLKGCVDDFALLIDRYEKTLYGFILHIIRNPHAAEDVTQEVFVIAYEKLSSLRNPNAFSAWIFKIARREAIRFNKKSNRFESHQIFHFSHQSEAQQIPYEERVAIFDALKKLPKHEQKTIFLKHFGGYTAQEIADMNGSPVGAITKRLSRAYTRLRVWLKELES